MTLDELHNQLEDKQREMTQDRFMYLDSEIELNGEAIKAVEELKELREKYKNVSEAYMKCNLELFRLQTARKEE